MTDEFEVPIPKSYDENQDAERGPKTVWPIFPSWGKWGILLEFRPPSSFNKFPLVMIQAIGREGETFKKSRKKFNDRQRETGLYTPTISVPFNMLPIIINALNEAWLAHKDDHAAAPLERPQADDGLEDYRRMVDGSREDMAVGNMGEFGGGTRQKSSPPTEHDIWATLKREAAQNKPMSPDAPPISTSEDDTDGFAEFGGSGGGKDSVPF